MDVQSSALCFIAGSLVASLIWHKAEKERQERARKSLDDAKKIIARAVALVMKGGFASELRGLEWLMEQHDRHGKALREILHEARAMSGGGIAPS